jgi:pimeloyl-ACP methyl ester carboxylesterase
MSSLLRVSVLLLSLCFAHPALASTAVSGTLTGNTTWTKADSPYVVSNVTIPAGTTLTIDPGVVVKMSARVFFYVFGTVNAQGTAAEPIIFTAITDDSVGGDSNGDQGATLPSVGDWLSLYFLEGSQGTFVNTEIRYGGASNGATPMGALHNQGGSIVLTDCILTDALNYPLAQDSGMTTLTTSTIERGGSGLRMTDGVFALSGNTFTDTLISIDPRVDFINHGNNTGTKGFSFGGQTAANLSGTMTHDQTWVPDGLPYVVADTLTVPALHSLTILPGTTVHMTMHTLYVSGTLTSGVSGASERVTFTSPSVTPQPGDWLGVNFLSGSHGAFHATDLRYGAHSFGFGYFNGMIMNQGGTITMDDTTLTDAGDAAIHHESGTLAITASTIARATLGIRVWGGTVELHDSSLHDLSAYGVYNIGSIAVDATNNWWGSFTGPTHPSHPIGTGAVVSNNVLFLPYRTIDPADVCTVNCNSNVLFLPGIEASRMYEPLVCNEAGTLCKTEQLWEPHGDRLALRLGHEVDGSSTNADIYVNGIIDNAYAPIKGNIYKSFIEGMNAMATSGTINAWEAVPYDWRLTPDQILSSGKVIYGGEGITYLEATSSPYIIQELKKLAESSKTKKVTIIAHSNGGLIAKALTEKLGTTTAAKLIDKIIFVAVPQVGTPKAIGSILHGFDQGIGSIFIGGDKITESAARVLARNMPMAYNLLPSADYFTYVDDPVVTFSDEPEVAIFRERYGEKIHSKERLHPFLVDSFRLASSTVDDLQYPSVGNDLLLTHAESLHQNIDEVAINKEIFLFSS